MNKDLACQILNISRAAAEVNSRRLEDDTATYYWSAGRGGSAVIVHDDRSFLFATSAVTFDEHVDEFRAGRRTDPKLLGLA